MIGNCTIAGNSPDGLYLRTNNSATVAVSNSILWNNGDDINNLGETFTMAYSDTQNGDNNGTNGCIRIDPLFVDTTYYHVQSSIGNYVNGYFSGGSWSVSSGFSPCIDAGDPASPYSAEPWPAGRHINLGAYGNTSVASFSRPFGMVITIQ